MQALITKSPTNNSTLGSGDTQLSTHRAQFSTHHSANISPTKSPRSHQHKTLNKLSSVPKKPQQTPPCSTMKRIINISNRVDGTTLTEVLNDHETSDGDNNSEIQTPTLLQTSKSDDSVPVIPKIGNTIQFDCTICLLYTSPSPRDRSLSRMPSSA